MHYGTWPLSRVVTVLTHSTGSSCQHGNLQMDDIFPRSSVDSIWQNWWCCYDHRSGAYLCFYNSDNPVLLSILMVRNVPLVFLQRQCENICLWLTWDRNSSQDIFSSLLNSCHLLECLVLRLASHYLNGFYMLQFVWQATQSWAVSKLPGKVPLLPEMKPL